jgi:filamentous hemagglutinin
LPDAIKTKYPELHTKYPNGVYYDSQGYPDFTPYVEAKVKLKEFNGRKADNKIANEEKGFKKTPDGYTWHHHQDGTTMQLVPKDLHEAFKHTGGIATSKHGVKGK